MAMAAMVEAAAAAIEQEEKTIDELKRLKDAVHKRASYIRQEAESLTLASFRRLLEQDLGLEPKELDVHKKQIKELVDEVLSSEEPTAVGSAPPDEAALNDAVEDPKTKKQEEQDSKTAEAEKEQGPRTKQPAKKRRLKRTVSSDTDKSEGPSGSSDRAQEASDGERSVSPARAPTKRKKSIKNCLEEDSERSSSPERKRPQIKKKTTNSKPLQNKDVEHLKQMIKSCGMNIPPAIYKRVKQVPDADRDAALVKELENLLKREGLNRHSSEKDVKAVKKKKEKQRDLEGIDVSNILAGGRAKRQAASNFYAVPQQKADENVEDSEAERQSSE